MSNLLGAIVVLVIGVLLVVWTAHILLDILGWILVVVAVIWVVRYLLGNRNRSNL